MRENRIVSHRAEMPEIARQADVQAAEHAWLSTAGAISKSVGMSRAGFSAQEGFQSAEQTQGEGTDLIDDQPAHADAVLEELIPIHVSTGMFGHSCGLAGGDDAPAVHSVPADQGRHGILRC